MDLSRRVEGIFGGSPECGKNVGKYFRKRLFIPRKFDFRAFLKLPANTRKENMVMRSCVFGQRIVRLAKPSGGTGCGSRSLRVERSNGSRSLRVERSAGREAFGWNGPTVREANDVVEVHLTEVDGSDEVVVRGNGSARQRATREHGGRA